MKKPLTEKETINKLLLTAKEFGIEYEFKKIYTKYNDLLKNCKNEKEKKDISILGNVEIHKLFNFAGGLVVDNKEIIPDLEKKE